MKFIELTCNDNDAVICIAINKIAGFSRNTYYHYETNSFRTEGTRIILAGVDDGNLIVKEDYETIKSILVKMAEQISYEKM